MKAEEIKIGLRVRMNANFPLVPAGTEGIIDEDYGSGVMVAWDLPDRRLPADYHCYDGRAAIAARIIRDGLDKEGELHLLEVV